MDLPPLPPKSVSSSTSAHNLNSAELKPLAIDKLRVGTEIKAQITRIFSLPPEHVQAITEKLAQSPKQFHYLQDLINRTLNPREQTKTALTNVLDSVNNVKPPSAQISSNTADPFKFTSTTQTPQTVNKPYSSRHTLDRSVQASDKLFLLQLKSSNKLF